MAKETEGKSGHANIFAALSAFQGELKAMPKTGTVEFSTQKGKVSFNYTPLGDIMTTIYPLLAKHGLSVRHEISKEGIEAVLTHETHKVVDYVGRNVEKREKTEFNVSEPVAMDPLARSREERTVDQAFSQRIEGEIRSGIVALKGGSEMKDTGAAITYGRRYTLTMVLGIASEDDKDSELLEQGAKNALAFAYSKAKQGIEGAKTVADLVKATNLLKKDLEQVKNGKAGALGLSEEQYEELLAMAEEKNKALQGE